jgi:hypothetical protein
MASSSKRPPKGPRRPSAYYRKFPTASIRQSASKKSGWDKAAVLVQAIGALAIFVSIAALFTGVRQFNDQQQATQAQTLDQQHQDTLNSYLDDMSALVLQYNLTTSKSGAPVRAIAVARTLTAVRYLDGIRKATLVRYLWEADLITEPQPVVNIAHANLGGAVFTGANLYRADLSGLSLANVSFVQAALNGVDFSRSDLSQANLSGTEMSCLKGVQPNVCTDLSDADLMNAEFVDANLSGADLQGADLAGANLTGADLAEANLSGANLEGATLDGANLAGANLQKALYNARPVQVKNALQEPVIEDPTRWPKGYDFKAAQVMCAAC